jgi:hypothetical protein
MGALYRCRSPEWLFNLLTWMCGRPAIPYGVHHG